LVRCIKHEFLDVINYAICQTVHEYLNERTHEFFRRLGEYHLNEALKRGLIKIEPNDKPLDVLTKIARYLESVGYMEKILINKISEKEAFVEMYGVSVTKSSANLIREGKEPFPLHDKYYVGSLKKIRHPSRVKGCRI